MYALKPKLLPGSTQRRDKFHDFLRRNNPIQIPVDKPEKFV